MSAGLAPLAWLIAALVAAATAAVLGSPILAVGAAALAVPFGSLATVHLGPGALTLTPLLLVGGATGLLWRRTAGAAASARFRIVAVAIGVYVAVVAVAALRAADLAAALVEGARWVELALALALAYFVGAPRATASTLTRLSARHVVAAALLLAGAAGAAAGIALAAAAEGPPAFAILGGRLARAYGTFGQPNPFGGYMNLVWPLGAALAFTAAVGVATRRRARAAGLPGSGGSGRSAVPWPTDPVPLWLAFLALAAALLAIAGLALSWSRGAWLAAAAAGAVMALFTALRYARPPWSAGGLAAAALVAGVVLAALSSAPAPDVRAGTFSAGAAARLGSIVGTFAAWGVADAEVTDANYATIERVAHWEAAYAMWADSPWLGQGPGQYERLYPRYRLPRWSAALGHAHNIYLHVLAETGLLGLAAYLGMIATAFFFAAHLAWARAGTFAGAVGLGLLGILAAGAVHGIVDNLYVHDMTVTLGLTMGLAGAAETASYRPSGWSA